MVQQYLSFNFCKTPLSFAFIYFILINLYSIVYSEQQYPYNSINNEKGIISYNYSFNKKFLATEISENFFVIHNYKTNTTFVYDGRYFYPIISKDSNLPNSFINLSCLNYSFKFNVLPYLNPEFLVKLLYVLNKISVQRISDAFRTFDQQERYKKRRWSPLETSPHQLGIAVDLIPVWGFNKTYIKTLCDELHLRYLEHGGKWNYHLHINDISKWTDLTPDKITSISKELYNSLPRQQISDVMIPYEKNNHYTILESSINIDRNYNYEIYFETVKLSTVRIIITSIIEEEAGQIYCGVFEKGENELKMDFSFLKKGAYIVKTFLNDEILDQKLIGIK